MATTTSLESGIRTEIDPLRGARFRTGLKAGAAFATAAPNSDRGIAR